MPRKLSKTINRLMRPSSLTILVVLVLVGFYLYHHLRNNNPSTRIVTAGTAVSPPKQSSSSQSAAKAPAESAGSRNIGTATDTQGNSTATTASSQWITSTSGLITVKQPLANARISDGAALSGSAKVTQIHYRLSDNKVGVISQGTLNVVNGDFSGNLHFSPQGTGARLDIFSTDSVGVEYNEVQINVGY